MNPKYHLLVAVAALSLGACSTDDTCIEPVIGGYKISFTVAEDPETRTTLDKGADGRDYLRWVPTDKVGVYTGGYNPNSNIMTVANVNQSPVEFVGTLEKLVSSGEKFYAYYPYDERQWTGTGPFSVDLSIPVVQKQTEAGVYNGESHPLVALPMVFQWEQGSDACHINNVRFRQLGAIVELQLYSSNEALRSEKIRSVTFESDTPLAGDFPFDLTSVKDTEEPRISGYELKKVTTLLEEPAAIPATKDGAARVYLTIAPGQYTGQIVVKTDAARYTFRLKNTMTFERAVIKGLPADLAEVTREAPMLENDPILFEDPVVEDVCVENWDTDGDGQLSYIEAATVTSIGLQFQIPDKTLIRSFNELRYFTELESIEYKAFYGCSSLTGILIPDGVTTIGGSVLGGCSSLTSINLPNGITAIGAGAFEDCISLTSITIPKGVTEIRESTFRGCSSLTSVNLPDGVTAIRWGAFSLCSSLTHINIPNGVTEITAHAFNGCSSLTSIVIPEGVTQIHAYVFYGCSSLTSVNLPDGVTIIRDSAFFGCSSLTNINLPDGLTAIERGAFYNCRSLTSIHIPKTVSGMGARVFVGCSSLSAFYFDGEYLRATADHRCVINRWGELYAFAPAGLTEYAIPNGVTMIDLYAFENCSRLTSIHIPDGVKNIEEGAFMGCSSLPSIHIPNSVIGIQNSAFKNCSSLTSVYCKPTTPPGLGFTTNLDHNAFYNTPSSMKIYVPAASVEKYKTAGGWSSYASQIFADNN